MRRLTRHARHIAAAAVAAGTLLTAALSAHAQDRQYIMATATTGGTYYPVGVAIATLSKLKLEPQYGFSLSAISSAGSGENVKLMRKDEAQFAILQGLYGAWAATGTGQLENTGPQENLRAVTMLWRNVEHFVLDTDYTKTRTIHDLKGLGKPFSMGKRNSGSEGSALHILSALGIEPGTDFDVINLGYGPSADAIQDGKAVGSAKAIVQAIDWMIQQKVPVINMSIGGGPNKLVEAAVQHADNLHEHIALPLGLPADIEWGARIDGRLPSRSGAVTKSCGGASSG